MSKKSTRALASATVMSLVLTTALSAVPVKAAAGEVTRVGESDRYATAAKVATTNWTTSDNVVLVSGEGYADAVSASALAKKLNAPILLTTAGSLNTDSQKALETLKAKNIYVVGGEASVSSSVRANLKKSYTLTELGGQNRYETNAAVAQKLVDLGVKADEVMMVGGEGFSDALSVAPIAAAKGQILLLGMNDANYMKPVIDFVKKNGSKVTVVGTKNVINDTIYNAVNAVKRVDGGQDRFDTNLKVLEAFKDTVKMDKMFVANATGDGYADALVASALAGKSAAPLVLVDKEGLAGTNNAINYVKENATKDTDLNVVGGTGVVTDATLEAIKEAVNKEPGKFVGTITSVEAVKDQTVNCKANEETLKLTVNGGKTVTVDDVIEAGYEVKFVADQNVFSEREIDGTRTEKESKDGVLSKDLLKTLLDTQDYFKYQVVVEKDGQIVAQSSKVEVKVINAEITATSIGDVTLKLDSDKNGSGTDEVELKSNKLVEGEQAVVTEVKGNSVDGKNNITITNTKFYSSNPFVATVNESTGEITAVNKGDFKLIVKSGSASKEISMNVVTEERKVNSATAAVSSIKMAKDANLNVEFVLKDQYGDPIKGAEFKGTSVTTDQGIGIEDVKDGDKVIAKVTTAVDTQTDKKGKIKLDIKNDGNTGKGTLKVKINSGKTVISMPVEIVAGGNVDEYRVEKVGDDKDFDLDLNPEAADKDGNSQVKIKINKYDKNDVFLGTVLSNTSVADDNITMELTQPNNTNILDESQTDNKLAIDNSKIQADGTIVLNTRYEDGGSNETFVLRDDKPGIAETGTLTLNIKKGSEVKTTVKINVKDSSPTISSVNVKETSVKSVDTLNLEDLIKGEDITASKSAGEGHVIIANNGTIFMNYNTTGEVDSDNKPVDPNNDANEDITTSSAIKFTAGKDIYLGKVTFTSEDGKATAKLKDDGTVEFKNEDGKDHYVIMGITKAHDKTPFKTVKILVSSK